MSARLWTKMVVGGLAMCVGGPALVYYVTPSEEELFLKYNPELQKRSLANRRQNQEDFEAFVGKLKEYSKSNRPIWEVAKADEAATRARAAERKASAGAKVAAVPLALQPPAPPKAPLPDAASLTAQRKEEEEMRKALKAEALKSR